MHTLKATFVGQIFALAKPHDSVGKRTRNRIPKEERKALVESFIKKHQKVNNGSFPSLSLTHKEVGGSFYTIREIVREIIQENRVLGPGGLLLEGNGSDHMQYQSLLSSVQMDPVAPLSLSQDGYHFASVQSHNFSSEAVETKSSENGEIINGTQASPEHRGSNILNCWEVNGNQLFKEELELLAHQPMGSTDLSRTQSAASCSEENDTKHDSGLQNRVQTVCDGFANKFQDQELDVDDKDRGFEKIPIMESDGTKPVNSEERSVTSEMYSLDIQPGELYEVCEVGEGTVTNLETDSGTVNLVSLGEVSSSISAVLEEKGTEVIVGQMPNHISVHMETEVVERFVNPALVDVKCTECAEAAVVTAVIDNIHLTKEFSNRTLTSEQKISTSGTESGSCENGRAKVDTMSSHAGNEVASIEKATMEKGKLDASDSSSSQKGNSATLNRIKPESWKETSNMEGHETNLLMAVLKSFLTAFLKFWSE